MNRSRVSLLPSVLVTAALLLSADRATAQEVGLAPLDVKEVARGYRAEGLKLKPIANEKSQVLGKISDFIFSKDGSNIFVVLAVDDFPGPGSHLIAIPFRSIKLDDPSGYLVLPGASAAALDKLPVFAYNR
jgi:PRC-barrel domain